MKKPKWILIFSILSAITFFIFGIVLLLLVASFSKISCLILVILSIICGIMEYNSDIEGEARRLEQIEFLQNLIREVRNR